MVCWVSCAGTVRGDFSARAALGRQRSAPQRAAGVRKAWLRTRGRAGSLSSRAKRVLREANVKAKFSKRTINFFIYAFPAPPYGTSATT